MNKYIFYLILLVLCSTGFYLKFQKNHQDIPMRCDEFGYMNLAKVFDENIAYVEHTKRPYMPQLLDTLRKSSITEEEIDWMVVPHAYYVVPNTNKIVNQYPPATSWLLSLFPLEHRRMLFPLIAVFLFLLFPFLSQLNIKQKKVNWTDCALVLFVFIMSVSVPFITEFARINSLAFTFGLLLTAGMLVERNTILAFFLIALTINFRPVNMLMLIPIITFIPISTWLREKNYTAFITAILKYVGLLILAVLPYFVYVYLLFGNPFMSTYSSYDTTANNNLFENMLFYFNINRHWFIFHLVVVGVLLTLSLLKITSYTFFFQSLFFPIFNYVFFIYHDIHLDYYPYASSIILLGICIAQIQKIPYKINHTKIALVFSLLIGITIFCDGLYTSYNNPVRSFEDAKKDYSCLCNYDIVWGELLTGSCEYVCGNNGYKYSPTSPRARKIAMKFLHDHHYKQAILLNDNLVDKQTVIEEVSSINLKYHIVFDNIVKEILVLE